MCPTRKIRLFSALLALAGGLLLGQVGATETRSESLLQQLLQSAPGEDTSLVSLLEQAANDPGLLPLERDQLMHRFIDALRAMPPGSIDAAALDYLQHYRPQAYRPDEHQPAISVPVHNIAAAARGLEHAWQAQEAAYAGAVLLGRDPAALVQAFALHQELPVRRGLLQALDGADPGQLEMISFLALSAIEQAPDLATLAGEAALRTGDTRALEQLLRTGSGNALTHTLRASRERLAPAQIERLLDIAIAHARPEVAAVTIAELSPALSAQPGATERLFRLLGDPQLGAAAALALAARPSDAVIARLADMATASGTAALAAGRARLALELVSVQAGAEPRP